MNQSIDIVIPAAVGGRPGTLKINQSFKVFRCTDLDNDFYAIGGLTGAKIHVSVINQGFGSDTGKETYSSLTLLNLNGADVNATIYIGDENLSEPQVTTTIDTSASVSTTAKLVVALGLAANPTVLGAGNFSFLKIIAQASLKRGIDVNAGNVYVGAFNDNNKLYRTLAPGDELTIEAPLGKSRKLSDFYMNADNIGDGIVIEYS